MAKIGDTTIAGVEVEIHATAGGSGRGEWQIYKGDQRLGRGTDLEKAERAAGTSIRKAKIKVSVPFFTSLGEAGVATGIHVGNGSVLAKVGGQSEQLSGYGVRPLRGDTPADTIAELVETIQQQREAAETQRRIAKNFGFDLRAAVEKAIAEETNQ